MDVKTQSLGEALTQAPEAAAPQADSPVDRAERGWGSFIWFLVKLLIAVLAGQLRYDLVRTNGLKLAITAGFTILALGIFVWRDQVAWLPGLLVAAGTLLGVRLGVGFAHKVSQRVLKWILLVMVVTVCAAAAFK
jgi:uncharacterized membrane protein YfcA